MIALEVDMLSGWDDYVTVERRRQRGEKKKVSKENIFFWEK